MAVEVVTSQIPDPRIRGICTRTKDPSVPRPSLDKCTSIKNGKNVATGSGFRIGSLVEYDGVIRPVCSISFYSIQKSCVLEGTTNIVTILDLGGIKVPWDEVKLIKL